MLAGEPDLILAALVALEHPCLTNFDITGAEHAEIERVGALAIQILRDKAIMQSTIAKFRGLWGRNVLASANLISKLPPASALFKKFGDVPAIIVAPGPSLPKNIDELKRASGRAVLIALPGACPSLSQAGISPDIVSACDPQACVAGDVAKTKDPFALVAAITVDPGVLASSFPYRFTYGGNTCGPYGDTWTLPELSHVPPFPSGGSVAHIAYRLAASMGCKDIILVGHDHALAEDGRKYAEADSTVGVDSTDGQIKPWKEPKTKIPGYYGGEVEAFIDHAMFAKYLGALVLGGVSDGIRTVNATEGGAYIAGCYNLPLSEAIKTCLGDEYPIRERIQAAYREEDRAIDFESLRKKAELIIGGTP